MTQPVSGSGLIHELSIESTSSRIILDFKNIFTEISYYESMDSPSASMSISIADGVTLKTSLPIIGGENVRFSLSDSEPESRSSQLQDERILYHLFCNMTGRNMK